MKIPNFWYKKKSILSNTLLPISVLYNFFSLILQSTKKEVKIKIPTICVGNLTIGGSGKTPVVIALNKILSKKYKRIHTLLRGYKGKINFPKIVEENDDAKLVGDEALIHRMNNYTCIAKNKIDGAKLCLKNKADLIILDDGLQSTHIFKNLSFIVTDSLFMFGNRKLFPSGPLRESIKTGFSKANALIIIKNSLKEKIINIPKNIPIFFAQKLIKLPKLKSKNIYAFCGLGIHEKFYNSLEKNGLNIEEKENFKDHHFFKDNEILKIIRISKKKKLEILTTRKDYVKINPNLKKHIKVVDLEIKFDSEKKIFNFIQKSLKSNLNQN